MRGGQLRLCSARRAAQERSRQNARLITADAATAGLPASAADQPVLRRASYEFNITAQPLPQPPPPSTTQGPRP